MSCCNLNGFSSISQVKVRFKTFSDPVYFRSGYLYISRHFDALTTWNDYQTALMTAGGTGGLAFNMDPSQGDYTGNTYQTSIKNIVSGSVLVASSDGSREMLQLIRLMLRAISKFA
jgi:hypothetical protein